MRRHNKMIMTHGAASICCAVLLAVPAVVQAAPEEDGDAASQDADENEEGTDDEGAADEEDDAGAEASADGSSESKASSDSGASSDADASSTSTTGSMSVGASGASGEGEANASESDDAGDEEGPDADPEMCDGYKKGTKARCLTPKGHDALMADSKVNLGTVRYRAGKGLDLTSEDERFQLVTRLRAQLRYTYMHDKLQVDDPDTDRNESLSHSLQFRRARLQFVGHAFNKHNKFKTEFAFSPRDLGFKDGSPTHTPVLTWYFEFDYLRDATFRMGQYKIPYSRQRVISSGDLMLVDRSIANGEFNVDRDIGIDVRSKDLGGIDRLKYYVGVYLGDGRDQFQQTDFGMHYLARLEYLPFGGFKDYKESDHERTRRPRLAIGAAVSFNDNAKNNRGTVGSTPSDGGTSDVLAANGDFIFKISGFSAQGAFFWRKSWREFGDAEIEDENGVLVPAPQEAPRTGIGWHGQMGYLIPRVPIEFAGRYAQVRPIGNELESSLSFRDEVQGGISYYIAGHPLKLQADYTHTWQRDHADVLEKQQDMVRVQLQLAF